MLWCCGVWVVGRVLERSGGAIRMAEAVLRVVGPKYPALAMSFIGFIVSIPVFCDSAFVILSSLKHSILVKHRTSAVAMTVALSTGLYAAHTFIPPTPGPITAAGNLGLEANLGWVIVAGIPIALMATLVGYAWAQWCGRRYTSGEDHLSDSQLSDDGSAAIDPSGLPSTALSFAPVFVPIVLIALGTVAAYPSHPVGTGMLAALFQLVGDPVNALVIGLILALPLLPALNKDTLSGWVGDGLKSAGPIILITGAGGALGRYWRPRPWPA